MENTFKINTSLQRYPHRATERLQAWDSADELILQHLGELCAQGLDLANQRILILNDSFGALSSTLGAFESALGPAPSGALTRFSLTSYTDSYVSAQAQRLNSQGRITPIHRLEELSGVYDLVLIRIPKNMSFFEDELRNLSGHLHARSKIICGYMIKHQAKSSFEWLGKIIGDTTTSLARKKARLIFADFQRAPSRSPYPMRVEIEGFEIPFVHHSNLFSREKLDIGTRFLLQHLPQGDYKTILDLGCANGIVGIAAKRLNPSARIIFSDESQMAVQSARANYDAYFAKIAKDASAQFIWTHCFENAPPASVDLVICNPPFHQGTTLGDHIAWQMFIDSRHALAPGGRLLVIGNTHLQYPNALKRIFGNSQVVAADAKFTGVEAVAG